LAALSASVQALFFIDHHRYNKKLNPE